MASGRVIFLHAKSGGQNEWNGYDGSNHGEVVLEREINDFLLKLKTGG